MQEEPGPVPGVAGHEAACRSVLPASRRAAGV